MKKWFIGGVFVLIIGVPLFWAFLKDVENNGASYGLLELLSVIAYPIFGLITLLLFAGYWGGIPIIIGKFEKKINNCLACM